ncbi:hypothetical protein R3P38DRAFT_3187221 [Favolaschia claudopus]|uniref:Uncharacterized protein n=1 Tax=Favolaschia claudopus TaxID=2862362 RepID=A0AAW0BZZ4_9AGAR
MSAHIRQARAHVRHANRAGGFFGGLFPGGDPEKPTDPTDPGKAAADAAAAASSSLAAAVSSASAQRASLASAAAASASAADSAAAASLSAAAAAAAASASAAAASASQAAAQSSSISPSSTPPPSSTTHSSISVTTTFTGTALHQNLTITHTAQVTAANANANAQKSDTPAPSNTNALVAPVLGGVAGGVVGLALLVFLITWFMRRRRPDQDAINFDPGAFRRSAMLMADPPTHQDTVDRGYNPAPGPDMVERRPIYTQASFDNNMGVNSPTSGSQLVFQAPFSPITAGPNVSSPVSAYDHHSWGTPGMPMGMAGGSVPVLTRNISGSSAHSAHSATAPPYAAYPAVPVRQNSMRNSQLAPPQDYVDLERTSVTPFQAEQYVEISKHLNTDVPRGLDTPTVSQIVSEKMDLPPLPPSDHVNETEAADPFADEEAHEQEQGNDSSDTLGMVQDMSFPAPPSPVRTSSSRYARDRVESMPPTLPEIIVQSRVSVTSAYLSDAGSAPHSQTVFMNAELGKGGRDSPMGGNRFPVSPSPLASSFTALPSPPAVAKSFPPVAAAVPEAAPAQEQQQQARPQPKKREPVYSTVYDPEDAYGGF